METVYILIGVNQEDNDDIMDTAYVSENTALEQAELMNKEQYIEEEKQHLSQDEIAEAEKYVNAYGYTALAKEWNFVTVCKVRKVKVAR